MTHNLKKIILVAISIFMVSAVFAKPGNPIPSFNFLLKNKAYFQEINSAVLRPEKRDMNVSNDTPGVFNYTPGFKPVGFDPDCIEVIIYRLDMTVVLGPFIIPAGETLTVPIDGQSWGVDADSHHQNVISVWINRDL